MNWFDLYIFTGWNRDFAVFLPVILLLFLSAFTVQLQDEEQKFHVFPSL